MRAPAPARFTTTASPSLYGGWQATTTRRGPDEHGNPVTQRDIYREGIADSTESQETLSSDPRVGGTTTSYNPL